MIYCRVKTPTRQRISRPVVDVAAGTHVVNAVKVGAALVGVVVALLARVMVLPRTAIVPHVPVVWQGGPQRRPLLQVLRRHVQGVSEKSASSAITSSYNIDTNWYSNTGTTDHVTGDLEKLTMRDRYQGADQVHTASGTGMEIEQIGHSVVHAPSGDLALNNILYVPQTNKSLVSVHKFAVDNDAFFESHPHYFFIKDRATKKVLLRARCESGLYPLKPPPTPSANKRMLASAKLLPSLWHNRLSHPSSSVVQQILSKNKLPHSSQSSHRTICDACQQGKSH